MNDKEYTKYLEENFPFPISSETLNELKQLINIDILEEIYVPRSELANKLSEGLYACSDLNKKFMELLHENNFDFVTPPDYAPRFEYTYNGKSNYPTDDIKTYKNENGTDYISLASDYIFKKDKEFLDVYGPVKKFKNFSPYSHFETENYLQSFLFDIMYNILISFDNLKNKKLSLDKGNAGEDYVAKELSLFKDKYKFAENIILPHSDLKGKTSETDLYVLTSKGILVCEIKNKGNEKYIFKIGKDGQWTKHNATGKFLETMDSPFAQNTRHCIATEQFLKDNGITDFKIIPVVIIANEQVRIENNSDNIVIRASELYNFVERLDYPEKYNEEYQNKVLNTLKDKSIKKENLFKVLSVKYDSEDKIISATSKVLDTYKSWLNYRYTVNYDGRLKNSKAHFKRFKKLKIFLGVCLLFDIYSIISIFTKHFSLICLLPLAVTLLIFPFFKSELDVG